MLLDEELPLTLDEEFDVLPLEPAVEPDELLLDVLLELEVLLVLDVVDVLDVLVVLEVPPVEELPELSVLFFSIVSLAVSVFLESTTPKLFPGCVLEVI